MIASEESIAVSRESSKEMYGAILLADISGSTPLFEAAGNTEAQRLISRELMRLRTALGEEDGVLVREKGDDVLCYFEDPSKAYSAARAMLSRQANPALPIHAGLHFGEFIVAGGSIFGTAVNLTARLASLANAGEALLSRSFFDQLSTRETSILKALGSIPLKGFSKPIEIFSFIDDHADTSTQ